MIYDNVSVQCHVVSFSDLNETGNYRREQMCVLRMVLALNVSVIIWGQTTKTKVTVLLLHDSAA